jgi:HPr kinase/phosphorylase
MKLRVKDLGAFFKVLAGGAGLKREIASAQVVEPDLLAPAAAGREASSVVHIRPRQLAVLASLSRQERVRRIREMVKQKPACLIVSGGTVCAELLEQAEVSSIPLLKTGTLPKFTRVLSEKFAPRVSVHGVLVDIFGIGALIIGESAVGKSEAALDLVLRGHKLAADDVVLLEKTDHEIQGGPTEMGADLLQIRGLGVINIRALYGESATASSCKIGLVVELEEWHKGHQYSLVGLRERRHRILGVNLPYLKLPVKPGRNMATLIEVAARNQMMKQQGVFAAREFNKKLRQRLTG